MVAFSIDMYVLLCLHSLVDILLVKYFKFMFISCDILFSQLKRNPLNDCDNENTTICSRSNNYCRYGESFLKDFSEILKRLIF